MEPRPALARRALAAVAALLLVAGLAGCSDSDRVGQRTAATVGDTEISQQLVLDLMQAQIRYAELSTAAAKQAAKASPKDTSLQSQVDTAQANEKDLKTTYGGTGNAAGTDSVGTAGAAEVLSTAIQLGLLRETAHEAGVKVTEAAVRQARQSLVENLKTRGLTTVKGLGPLLDLYGELQAYQDALTKAFASTDAEREAQLKAAFEQGLDEQSQYCINFVATADEASARAAFARVQAGEDFLAVGNEVSIDTSSLAEGKELCITGTQLFGVFTDVQPPIAEGTLLAPVDGQGSWLFARVVRTQVPTFEQLRPQLEANTPDAAATTKVQKALTKAQKRLEITVDPRYGTWNPKTGVVDPPKVEPTGTTTTSTTLLTTPSTPAGS